MAPLFNTDMPQPLLEPLQPPGAPLRTTPSFADVLELSQKLSSLMVDQRRLTSQLDNIRYIVIDMLHTLASTERPLTPPRFYRRPQRSASFNRDRTPPR